MRYKDWCDSIDGCRNAQHPLEQHAQPVLGGFETAATIPTGDLGGSLFPSMAIQNAVPEALMLEAMALQSSPQSLIGLLGGFDPATTPTGDLMGGGFDTVMAPTGYFDSGNFALGF